jgi:aspartate--ammonia ligase
MKNNLIDTQIKIKYIKDTFELALAKKLNLIRVSAPLFVNKNSGLNDGLSGKEESVSFKVNNEEIEIVHSLAKWKRRALKDYNFPLDTGLYTDMNAIRKDENLDEIHSVYVDQWDWEKKINKENRNKKYLFSTVRKIYSVIYSISKKLEKKWDIKYNLPKKITFISTKKAEAMYKDVSSKEREHILSKTYGAIFLYEIGWPLKNKLPHDFRASDYDDWKLNGDIILYFAPLDIGLEISSMGIRVNKESLIKQTKYKNEEDKLSSPYCIDILNETLPLTIGGGIGQSRLCMFYLNKKHIGEVQSTYWPKEYKEKLLKEGLDIL